MKIVIRSAPVSLMAAGFLLGSCAAMPPAPPAVLTATSRDCALRPDLASAVSLVPDKERSLHHVAVQVGSATPCVQREGLNTAYVLYALPADLDDKTLTVGGYLEPLRILSPRVELLDATGNTIRQFRSDDYMYRGLTYSVLFRPRPDERFILVTIDPTRVGQRYDSIAIGTNTSATAAPVAGLAAGLVGSGNITTGTDVSLSRTFSYEGAVQAIVNDSDTEEQPANGT